MYCGNEHTAVTMARCLQRSTSGNAITLSPPTKPRHHNGKFIIFICKCKEMNRCSCDMQAYQCVVYVYAPTKNIPLEFKLKNSTPVCNCKCWNRTTRSRKWESAAEIKITIFIWYCFSFAKEMRSTYSTRAMQIKLQIFWERGEKYTYIRAHSCTIQTFKPVKATHFADILCCHCFILAVRRACAMCVVYFCLFFVSGIKNWKLRIRN